MDRPAFGHQGIIGPFFFDQNVNAESYLELISEQFHSEFCAFENSSEFSDRGSGRRPSKNKEAHKRRGCYIVTTE